MAEQNTNPAVDESALPSVEVDDNGVVTETGTTSTSQSEYSDVEKRAMSQGWVPEDQYEGSGKWRSAEEFLDRGELFAKIDDLNRRNKGVEYTLQEFKKHHKAVKETEYKRALATLRAQKVEALDNGNSALVVDIDERIANTKFQAARELQAMDQAPAPIQQVNPTLQVWINKNDWYENNRAMRAFADTLGEELAYKGVTDPIEILNEVERQVKKEFAHKFTNPNRSRPGAVEGGGARGNSVKETFQLSPEETKAMNAFVKNGVLTKAQYIAEIKAQRGN